MTTAREAPMRELLESDAMLFILAALSAFGLLSAAFLGCTLAQFARWKNQQEKTAKASR